MVKPYDVKAIPPVDVLIENVQMLCEEYGSQLQQVRTQLDAANAEIARLQAELAEAREKWQSIGAEEELRRLAGIMRDTEMAEEYSNQLVKWLAARAEEIKARREATDEA